MVISFSEAALGQLFHEKNKDGNYYGGASYYMTNGIGNKPLAIAYAITTVIAVGICIAMLQNNSITASVTGLFNVSPWIPSIIVVIIAGIIIIGGVKRITDVASLIVPFMAVIYILITIFIIITHITQIPSMFAMIFKSAFSTEAAVGGVAGYTIKEAVRNGVARGLFSNDAGNGAAATMHASAIVKHPANQGFSAMFGTFLTTIIICSCSGFSILLTGALDSGKTGINLVQDAFHNILGSAGNYFVMVITFLFCFTTLIADLFYGEVGIRYLFKQNTSKINIAVKIFQIIALLLVAIGAVLPLPVIWDLVDFSVAFLVFFNVFALLRMIKYVKYIFNDYILQFRSGKKEPTWDESINIKDKCK